MANALFNSENFIRDLPPVLRRKRVTFAIRDTVNQYVFQRRLQLDPNFVIPSFHTSRWQPVESDSTSDSSQSEIDSDEDALSFTEQNDWINGLIGHLRAIFANTLSNNEQREFAVQFADRLGLSPKQRTRLNIL